MVLSPESMDLTDSVKEMDREEEIQLIESLLTSFGEKGVSFADLKGTLTLNYY